MSKSTPTPRQRLIAELRERKRMEVVYDGVGRSHWECRHDHHDDLCQRAAREIEALSELVQEALRDAQDCATVEKFNEVSARVGFPGRIELSPISAERTPEGYPGIAHDLETMRAALTELVALKAMKDALDALDPASKLGENLHQQRLADYKRRKPLAWEAARAALKNAAPQVPQQEVSSGVMESNTGERPKARDESGSDTAPAAAAPEESDEEFARKVEQMDAPVRKVTLSENLRILRARLSDHLSPAESRELDEAARLLEARSATLPPTDRDAIIEECAAVCEQKRTNKEHRDNQMMDAALTYAARDIRALKNNALADPSEEYRLSKSEEAAALPAGR